MNRSMKINDLFDFHAQWVLLEIVKMRSQSDFMRRESKPSTEIPSTFVVHKFYTVMNDNEQKELSYHRVQQMIQDQIDLGVKKEEETHDRNHTACSLVAIIKRFLKMRCLHSRKRRRTSAPNDWTEQSPQSLIWNPRPEEHLSECHDKWDRTDEVVQHPNQPNCSIVSIAYKLYQGPIVTQHTFLYYETIFTFSGFLDHLHAFCRKCYGTKRAV